jgi:F5/8 type C domain
VLAGTPGGTQTVGAGSSLSIPTRRPDLTPTTNVARCKPASYSIQTSLDGSTWTNAPPADSTGQFRNPVQARYVRVNMTVASGAGRTGIRGGGDGLQIVAG